MYYKCPKCNGKGRIRNVGSTIIATVFTFGIMTAIDCMSGSKTLTDECGLCDGKGILNK